MSQKRKYKLLRNFAKDAQTLRNCENIIFRKIDKNLSYTLTKCCRVGGEMGTLIHANGNMHHSTTLKCATILPIKV